jgi:anti-anti-sigma factor
MEKRRYIQFDRRPGAVVIRFVESDLSGPTFAEILDVELAQLVSDLRPSRMVVDFSGVKTITSSVIGVLLKTRRKLLQEGGRLRLCCVPLPIQEIYRTLNLDRRILPVYRTVEDALDAADVQADRSYEQMED